MLQVCGYPHRSVRVPDIGVCSCIHRHSSGVCASRRRTGIFDNDCVLPFEWSRNGGPVIGPQDQQEPRPSTRDETSASSVLAARRQGIGQCDDASRSLLELLALRPFDASLWRLLGDQLLAAGNAADATDCYRRALELEPENPRAQNNLGQALLRLGRLAEARECYERAISLD
jgi:tetratricopeptide (TPR) repeat protein